MNKKRLIISALVFIVIIGTIILLVVNLNKSNDDKKIEDKTEKEQEFKITMSMANRALMAVVLSDLLMKLLYATRPYEKIKGQSTERYLGICQQILNCILMEAML